MSELMAWDGPWSKDLIRLMLPVAVEILTRREQETHRALMAAIGSLFDSKVARDYSDSLEGVLKKVKREQLEARGLSKEDISDLMLEEFVKKLQKLPKMRGG